MSGQYGVDQDQVSVAGFDVPSSPDASYNNIYPANEDEGENRLPCPPLAAYFVKPSNQQ
ncbi:UNVERIFIED_CONTAM: hypothetical protein Sradi_0399900 [Sesamum radiatum]|uniref:Uncharacterized protein n=1 Tax=Sesamum radiatum TaxID=300843 RepID=A0AAW2W9T9_SESRA